MTKRERNAIEHRATGIATGYGINILVEEKDDGQLRVALTDHNE